MYIETERMIVRDFVLDDLNDLQAILGDEETMKCCEEPYGIEKTAAFLQNFCIEKRGAVAAVLKETGKAIGYILFHAFDGGAYEIGWIYNKAYWGQGYAFESLKAVIEYAFDRLHAQKIFAETMDERKSVPLMQKLGMTLEGIQETQEKDHRGNGADLYMYVLFAEGRTGS